MVAGPGPHSPLAAKRGGIGTRAMGGQWPLSVTAGPKPHPGAQSHCDTPRQGRSLLRDLPFPSPSLHTDLFCTVQLTAFLASLLSWAFVSCPHRLHRTPLGWALRRPSAIPGVAKAGSWNSRCLKGNEEHGPATLLYQPCSAGSPCLPRSR